MSGSYIYVDELLIFKDTEHANLLVFFITISTSEVNVWILPENNNSQLMS